RSGPYQQDILFAILYLCRYKDAVRTASVSRRWERLIAQLPNLTLCMSLQGRLIPIGWLSARAAHGVPGGMDLSCKEFFYRSKSIKNSNYSQTPPGPVRPTGQTGRSPAGQATAPDRSDRLVRPVDVNFGCQHISPVFWYAVRPPHIHGTSATTLQSLKLQGLTVLRQDFLLAALPSLEDLFIGDCTLPASIAITSDAMPRLRHLDIVDVSVMMRDTKAGISVLADELRMLRMSCHGYSSTESPSDPKWFLLGLGSRFRASLTSYASFRLRAQRLWVFDWRCCYTDEVRVESVGRLSDVTDSRTAHKETWFVFKEYRDDKLMWDILQDLMRVLKPRSWGDVQ
ncbi:hypothetical protein PVAP13_9NG419870, partial [Panicum virgatum]